MEVVDKQGTVIHTEKIKVSAKEFLENVMPKFTEVRAEVKGGDKPFASIYLVVDKEELKQGVTMFQMEVTYSIAYNSRVQKQLNDVLYIHQLNQTIV